MKQSPYSVHPGLAMVQSVVAKMKEKTGRTLDEWIAFVKKHGPATEKERREWLKREHQLGTNYAAWIVAEAECRAWATAVARSEQAPPPQITSLNRAELAMAYSVAALNRAALLARRSELMDACMATRGFKR